MERMAHAMVKSRMYGFETVDQALALMAIAVAEGKHPGIIARDFHLIEGRPAKKSEAMMRDFCAAGGRVEWHTLTDEAAEATFSHPAGGRVRIKWDMERAERAGLAGRQTWRKYPRQMLRSRVVSEGVRTVAPLATSGVYTPEEVEDERREPIVVDATLEPETQSLTTDEVAEYLLQIGQAETVDALKRVYSLAWRAAREDSARLAMFSAAKDARKAALEAAITGENA
jgi:hypothetical protein